MRTTTKPDGLLSSSFRDPGGLLYRHEGRLLRQINSTSEADFRQLMDSGLYDSLCRKRLLVPHREVELDLAATPGAAVVIEPDELPFISYPYEWCFSQLQDAALCTLRLQKLALRKGMALKDASAYNIQFHNGAPLLIDTLSFAGYSEGEPWVAYRQFCQHFLAPLALMAYCDIRLGDLLCTNIDGVPLDLASRLLPWRTRLRPGLFMHLHAHAASQKKYADRHESGRTTKVGKKALTGILDSLRSTVASLHWRAAGTEWGEYYSDTNYSDEAVNAKRDLVAAYLDRCGDGPVWDLGANNGFFSRIASEGGRSVIAFDVDPVAVEQNWRQCRREGEEKLLPLLMDLCNPSPGLGWDHAERSSLRERGPADTVLALALIHHLAITNNVPLDRLAEFFSSFCEFLIIEFVPKSDSQVQRLLATREDIFPAYTRAGFEAVFASFFEIVTQESITGSERQLYLMRRRASSG
ncbi:MAG: class I SAM-dependent methyltransferase [bacterium]